MITIDCSTTISRAAKEVFEFVMNQDNARLWLAGWFETRPTSDAAGVGATWIDVVEVLGHRGLAIVDKLREGD